MNHLKKYISLIVVVICLMSGCGKKDTIYLESAQESVTTEEIVTETDIQQVVGLCYVYVCGAVEAPGVYELPEGSHVFEAIELAGGLTEEAADDFINQAEVVSDGQMIKILTEEELQEQTKEDAETEEHPGKSDDGKVNINSATTDDLMTLPGVGQQKAESIVSYREENGAFSSVDAIKNVTGIKDGVYNQIKDKITVD